MAIVAVLGLGSRITAFSAATAVRELVGHALAGFFDLFDRFHVLPRCPA